ncbi:hypothetical protein [Pseudonocardia sp. N23]|uniref:hypothetical protein n=1 Tax=Pseudonocardia sp. N23 TaxID=1987376 RepID=UPI000C02E2EC|nr:hypothetical protein [Pseudonocardia sp. N23]GAY08116.1 citrate synthase [Pseudonocardia sp. N23]
MTDNAPALDVRSDICWSDETSVTVLGRDLCADLIGKVDLGSFAFLLLTERMPSDAEATLFNAALVSLVEHGITPNALATWLTYLGAPESLQSAVAAGLLGLGSRFVGTIEGSAQYLAAGADALGPDADDAAVAAEATRIVEGFRSRPAAQHHRRDRWQRGPAGCRLADRPRARRHRPHRRAGGSPARGAGRAHGQHHLAHHRRLRNPAPAPVTGATGAIVSAPGR